jgi:hypothetical protein
VKVRKLNLFSWIALICFGAQTVCPYKLLASTDGYVTPQELRMAAANGYTPTSSSNGNTDVNFSGTVVSSNNSQVRVTISSETLNSLVSSGTLQNYRSISQPVVPSSTRPYALSQENSGPSVSYGPVSDQGAKSSVALPGKPEYEITSIAAPKITPFLTVQPAAQNASAVDDPFVTAGTDAGPDVFDPAYTAALQKAGALTTDIPAQISISGAAAKSPEDAFYNLPGNQNAPQMDKDYTKYAINIETNSQKIFNTKFGVTYSNVPTKESDSGNSNPNQIFASGTDFIDFNSDGKIDYVDINQALGRLVQDPNGVVQWARDQGVQFDAQGNIVSVPDHLKAQNNIAGYTQADINNYNRVSATEQTNAQYRNAATSSMNAVTMFGDQNAQVDFQMLDDEVRYGGRVPDAIKKQRAPSLFQLWDGAVQKVGVAAPLVMVGALGSPLVESVIGADAGSLRAKEWGKGMFQWTGGLFNVPSTVLFGRSFSDPYRTDQMTLGERGKYLADHPIEVLEFGAAIYSGASLLSGGARVALGSLKAGVQGIRAAQGTAKLVQASNLVFGPLSNSSSMIRWAALAAGLPAYEYNKLTNTYRLGKDANGDPIIVDANGRPQTVDGISAYAMGMAAQVEHAATGDPDAEAYSQAYARQNISTNLSALSKDMAANYGVAGRIASIPIQMVNAPLSFAQFPVTYVDEVGTAARDGWSEGQAEATKKTERGLGLVGLRVAQATGGSIVGMYSFAGDVGVAGPVNFLSSVTGGDGKILKANWLGETSTNLPGIKMLGLNKYFNPVNQGTPEYPNLDFTIANLPYLLNFKKSVLGDSGKAPRPGILGYVEGFERAIMKPVDWGTKPLNLGFEAISNRITSGGSSEQGQGSDTTEAGPKVAIPIVPPGGVSSGRSTVENKGKQAPPRQEKTASTQISPGKVNPASVEQSGNAKQGTVQDAAPQEKNAILPPAGGPSGGAAAENKGDQAQTRKETAAQGQTSTSSEAAVATGGLTDSRVTEAGSPKIDSGEGAAQNKEAVIGEALKQKVNADTQDVSVQDVRNHFIDEHIAFLKNRNPDVESSEAALNVLSRRKTANDVYGKFQDDVYKSLRWKEYPLVEGEYPYEIDGKVTIDLVPGKDDLVINGKTMVRVDNQRGFNYRIPLSGEACLADIQSRISINTYAIDGIVEVLDNFFIRNNIEGYYKTPDDNYEWHWRNDPITIYFKEKPTDAQIKELVDITRPYIRSDADVLLGEKVAPGVAFEMEPTEQMVWSLEQEARLLDPAMGDAIRDRFFNKDGSSRHKLSAATYTAAKIMVEIAKGRISGSEAAKDPVHVLPHEGIFNQ